MTGFQNEKIMKWLILLYVMLPVIGLSQKGNFVPIELPMKDGRIFYEKVDSSSEKTTKAILFLKARQWFVSQYKNSKYPIEIEDKEMGKIVSKGTISYSPGMMPAHVTFVLNVDVKDAKYRIQAYDFSLTRGTGLHEKSDDLYRIYESYRTDKKNIRGPLIEGMDGRVMALIDDFMNHMKTPAISNDF